MENKTIDEIIESSGYSKEHEKIDIDGVYEIARAYAKQEVIAFLDELRGYEVENKQLIADDERTSEQLYNIYKEQNP